MTYTADDFKNARFATRGNENATRDIPDSAAGRPWQDIDGETFADSEMASNGWVPVQKSRAFPPSEITDEMVVRFLTAYDDWHDKTTVTPALKHWTTSRVNATRRALAAALTEPPARPEGAEELGVLIGEYLDSTPGVDDKGLADYLAERLTFTSKEQS